MAAGMAARWLRAVGIERREQLCWAAYDWANSAFYTTIVAAVYPIYFASVLCRGAEPGVAEARHGWATTASVASAALLAPLLGAVADFRALRKLLLALFTALGVASTAAMYWIGPGEWVRAAVLFGLANFAVAMAFVCYDALLPHVARRDELDRVSTAAYALGYLGGGLLLALQLAWIQAPERFGLPHGDALTDGERTLPARLALLSAGLWWGIFSLPLLFGVREPPRALEADESARAAVLRTAVRRLGETFREIRRYRQTFLMMLAFVLYSDGVMTIIRMAAMLGRSKGIPDGQLIGALLAVQFVGIPAAFAFGRLAGRLGAKRAILASLAVYVAVCVLAWRAQGAAGFWILALLVALVQGGCQALSRSLFASLVPRHKSGEFFGLFSVLEKFGGIFGPMLYAAVAGWTRSPGAAALSIVVFFVAGAAVLLRVDVDAGVAEARAAERAPAPAEGG